jgi:hypothetical protein
MEFDNSSEFNVTRHWNLFTEVFYHISCIFGGHYLVLASHKACSNVGLAGRRREGCSAAQDCHSRALLNLR